MEYVEISPGTKLAKARQEFDIDGILIKLYQ
jgi:hypothetical protein